jgi:hypothetical protein
MNQFQSIQSGQGILKDNYFPTDESSALTTALRRKRRKLAETKGMEAQDDTRSTAIGSQLNNSTGMS